MKKGKILVFILFFVIKFTTSFAQIDTTFWFAAPWVTPDHTWRDAVKVHISGAAGTSVTIRQPAAVAPNKYDTTFIMPGTNFFDYTFWRDAGASATNFGYDSLESRPANIVHPYGLHISSSAIITVVYDVVTRAPSFLNPETFSLKGQNGMGTEFVCPFQTNWKNQFFGGSACGANAQDLNCDGIVSQPKQQIAIVATMSNTVVWITPKTDIVGHLANITYSVAMNRGDVYTLENIYQLTNVAGQNLSGTIVVSNNPISVTVADDSVNTPGGGCFDLIGDQIVPVDVVGQEYIANKGFMFAASIESIFIVGTQNFTQLTINDGTATTYTINKGDTKQFSIVNPLTHIQANKNVYLWQTTGYGCEAGAAILPPINCAGSNSVTFTRNNNQPFLLNILVRAPAIGSFTLNGSTILVPAAAFTVVPGTAGAWYGAQIQFSTAQIPVNSANLIQNNLDVFALGIINGNTNTGGLFHYMSSFLRKVNIDAGPSFTFCAGTTNTISLNGLVSGGALSGIWSNMNGTGAIGTPTNLNTTYTLSPTDTTKTSISFLLTSTGNCTPVTDTFVVFIKKAPAAKILSSKNLTFCKNNIPVINISGSVVNAIGGQWSGGTGSYGNSGALSTTYLPSPGDISTGSVSVVLTPTGNICPGKSDTIKITFTNIPVVNATVPSFICASSTSIALTSTVTGGASTGIWSTNGTGGFSPNDTLLNTSYLLSPSDYTLSALTFTLNSTHNGLCSAVGNTFTISIIKLDIVNAGPNDTICATAGSIPLSGTVSLVSSTGVLWSTLGSGSFNSTTILNPNYTMSAADTLAGTVTLILTTTGGSCSGGKDTVTFAILKAPNVNAGRDSAYCNNINVPLKGLVTGFTNTGQWTSSGTGTFTPNNTALNGYYIPSLSDLASSSLTLTLLSTNNKGCSPQSDKVVISFKPSPNANFSFTTACANQPVNFTDNSSPAGSLTGGWNFGDGATAISLNAIHGYSLANTYTVTHWVQNSLPNGCYDTITKVVVVNSVPFPNFYYDTPCEGHPTHFYDSSFVNPGNITGWNWVFADGGKDTINKNPPHTYVSAGIYNVVLTVTSNNGCKATVTKPVNVRPKPTANFGMTNNPTLAQETVYFSDFSTPASTIVTWHWNFGDSISSNVQTPEHFYNNQGEFTVSLTISDQYGCSDTIRKPISVTLLPLVPSAFSPNGDGANDLLFVKGGPFENMHFRVYNNWGALIFETTDQKIGWDGKYNGEDQPMSVYVWVLDVDIYNNKSVRKTGDVTLIR